MPDNLARLNRHAAETRLLYWMDEGIKRTGTTVKARDIPLVASKDLVDPEYKLLDERGVPVGGTRREKPFWG